MDRSANFSPAPAPAPAPATTYVQADAHAFRDLVQRLTGAGDASNKPSLSAAPAPRSAVAPRRLPFKLQDRRGPSVRNLEIQLALASPRSSTPLKSPIPSPVTPLASQPLFSPAAAVAVAEDEADEEERAIAEKRFYLHPSPGSRPPPELLPLFPLSSPRQDRRE